MTVKIKIIKNSELRVMTVKLDRNEEFRDKRDDFKLERNEEFGVKIDDCQT